MATPKQIAANRANAKRSTGPRTKEGREKVAQNRLVHGLLGRFQVLEGEDQQRYDNLVDQLILEQKPVGLLETELVKKMSEHLWLSERARRYQEGCFLVLSRTPEQIKNDQAEMGILADLERFTIYQAHHDRAFQRALNVLLKLRKERLANEIGFEREKRAQAAEQRREKQEFRREEIHPVRYATAQIHLQLQEQKFLARAAAHGLTNLPPEPAAAPIAHANAIL
jgi:hypothetical protein